MASQVAIKRLTKEAQLMDKEPPPLVYARPREDNILEWHYILRGPPDTPYAGGEYYGLLIFPPEFPFRPPAIKMQTPSGRFAPDTKICTSMSDYHPHTWQPGWNTSTILIGLLSFMCSDEMTTGSVSASSADRKKLAAQSHSFNIAQKRFCQLFPEYAGSQIRDLPDMGNKADKSALEQEKVRSAASNEMSESANKLAAKTPVSSATNPESIPCEISANESSPAEASNRASNTPRPPPRPRRDLFGLRSSVVVLAVVAYLFISRVMETSKSGVI